MAAPSPESADAACERIRLAFRSWAPQEPGPPVREAVLTRGQSNRAIILAGAQRRWVLRIPCGPAPIGVCREREIAVHRRAAAAGLAPPVRFAEAASGILVTDYLVQRGEESPAQSAEARAHSVQSATTFGGARSIAGLLRAIHRLTPPTGTDGGFGPALDSAQRLRQWRRSLGDADPVATLEPARRVALDDATARLADERPLPVLCHNDLLAANRLRSDDGLVAIDWEYACLGDSSFDLAVAASEFDDSEADDLLEAYLERRPAATERRRFGDQLLVYLAIASCWHVAQGAPPAAVAAAIEALRRRCDVPTRP